MSCLAAYPSDKVTLREVGLRDGLQMVKSYPSTKAKQDWLTREHAAGVRHFELGSFLAAARFPQFADLPDLIGTANTLPGLHAAVLTLNEKGMDAAFASAISEVVCVGDARGVCAGNVSGNHRDHFNHYAYCAAFVNRSRHQSNLVWRHADDQSGTGLDHAARGDESVRAQGYYRRAIVPDHARCRPLCRLAHDRAALDLDVSGTGSVVADFGRVRAVLTVGGAVSGNRAPGSARHSRRR